MKNLLTALFFLFSQVCFSQSAPSVQLTAVPGWGGGGQLQGVVHNTTTGDHAIAVYIFLEEAGGWWIKPSAAAPVTVIRADSGFSAAIAIAPTDPYATKIIAFLVPVSYSPPALEGGDLPAALLDFPYAVICRPHGERVVSWSGLEWTVKRSIGSPPVPMGPGPNLFSDHDTMVWVDPQQRLHLRVARSNAGWSCSEVICRSSLGYQRYNFDVAGRTDLLDPNLIAGIFTWDDCSPLAKPPNNYYREIDLEFSRWGDPANSNAKFVVQPYDAAGNISRFNMTAADHSVHYFDWKHDSILFSSTWGDSARRWTYRNKTYLPEPGDENLRINFYLYQGLPPADGKNAEMILNSFTTGLPEPGRLPGNINIFPNPFSDGCQVEITLRQATEAEIDILNLQGRCIRKLFAGKPDAGTIHISWDGCAANGRILPPGVYLLRFRSVEENRVVKMVKW